MELMLRTIILIALALASAWCSAADLQLARTAPPFDVPNLAGIDGRQFTFSGSLGPVAPLPAGKLAIGGHQLFYDLAILTPPANGGTAVVEKWVEPSLGQIAAYSAAYKLQVPGAGQMIPRGAMFADGRFFGQIALYYNVRPDLNITGGWSSDGVSSFNGFSRTNFTCLQTGGRLGPLSKPFRDAWGHDTWCFESSMQNHAATNFLAMYTLNRKPNVIPGEIVPVTKRFDSPYGTAQKLYPPWDVWCEICGATCLPNHMIYTFRKPVGAKWYGVGSGIDSQTGPVASLLFPGQQARDDFDPNSKGYHAESYRHTLLGADRESILAGAPVFKEFDLAPLGLTAKCARDIPAYDEATDTLWLLEGYANGQLPRVHRFKTRTEADVIRQQITVLQQQQAAIQLQIDPLAKQIADLQAQIDALKAKLPN